MIKYFQLYFFLLTSCVIYSQTTEISGLVIANDNVENIHVINKTANKFTTTNALGEFIIQVRALDTLVFSSIQYKLKALIVTTDIIEQKAVVVELKENINKLNEVVVGRVLTRDLESDIENSQAKPKINFYDVGIPGYKGKPLTKREREFKDANNGKFFYYYGIGFSINIYKILNAASGRTKKLRQAVEIEKQEEMIYAVRIRFSESLFGESDFEDSQKMEFFYFCSDDDRFESICKTNNNMLIFEFLQEKLEAYKLNLKD